jgi:uncharacterized protein
MTREVFVDTGAWYALQVPDDRWHGEAVATLRELLRQGRTLVTSNLVIGETYTLLVRTHGNAAALRFVDTLDRSPRLSRVHVDEEEEGEGWQILRRFSDQDFSFVDGCSFAIMRQRRIVDAFAFDRHFATAGFVRLGQDG